jgi:hypothetical protein
MANHKKRKNELLDGDMDMDFAFDGADMDFNIDPMKDDRSPVMRHKDNFLEGMKDGVKDSAFIKKTMRGMLPKNYGTTIDFAGDTLDKVGNQVDHVRKELAPGLKDLRKNLSKVIPSDSKFVPLKLKEKLEEWKNERSGADNGPSEDEQRESMIGAQMAEIFKMEATERQAERKERSAKEAFQHGMDQVRHRDNMGVLSDIAASSARMDQYQRNVGLNFQKKSLEIQYRQLFALQDMVKLGHKQLELFANELPAIKKNTGLPDYVKQTTSEFVAEYNKRKLAETAGKFMFGSTKDYLTKTISNLGKKAAEGGKAMLDTGNMTLQQIEGAIEMASTTGGSIMDMVVGMGGDAAAQKAVTAILKLLPEKYLLKNKSAIRIATKAARRVANVNEDLNSWREEQLNNYEGGIFNALKRAVAEAMPGPGTTRSVHGIGLGNEAGGAAMFDKRAARSITDIIPGYLARILREVQVFRSGFSDKQFDTSIELEKYDIDKGDWVKHSEMKARAHARIFDEYSAGQVHMQGDAALAVIEAATGIRLTKDARAALKKRMMQNSLKMGQANAANFADAKHYGDGPIAEEVGKAMTEFFKKASGNQADAFASANRNIKEVNNTSGKAQDLVEQGHGDLLREMGVVDKDGETISTEYITNTYLAMQGRQKEAPKTKSLLDQAMGGEGEGLTAKAKRQARRAQEAALRGAKAAAKKMGASDKVATIFDQKDAAGMIKEAAKQAMETKAGKFGAGKIKDINKAINDLQSQGGAMGEIYRTGQIAKEVAQDLAKGNTDTIKKHAKSLIERCTVDGEIDYEILATELAKYPEIARTKILEFIAKLVEFGGKLKRGELFDKEPESKKGKKGDDTPSEIPVDQAGKPTPEDGVKQFAKGGLFSGRILNQPVGFELQQDGKPQQAVAGEAGKEAVIPVHDGGVQLLDEKGKRRGVLQLARDKMGRLSVTSAIKAIDNLVDRGDAFVKKHQQQLHQENLRKLAAGQAPGHKTFDEYVEQARQIIASRRRAEGKDDGFVGPLPESQVNALAKKLANAAKSGRGIVQDKFNAGKQWASGNATIAQMQKYVAGIVSGDGEANQAGGSSKGKKAHNKITDKMDEIISRLDVIAAKEMGYSPGPSLLRQNAKWLGKGFLSLGKMPLQGGWWMAKNTAKLGWGATKGMAGAAGAAGKAMWEAGKPKDVYVDGEDTPRLYGSAISAGAYTRKDSKDVLKSHNDVDQPILNKEGQIVISGDELDQLSYRSRNRVVRIVTKASKLGWKGLKLAGKGMGKLWGLSVKAFNIEMAMLNAVRKGVGKVFKAGYDFLGREVDVHTPGVEGPVLYASLLRKGYYRSKRTGDTIYSFFDIDGPVLDSDGNEAVTAEMLKAGLFDKNGKPIRGRFAKVMGAVVGTAWGAAKLMGKAAIGSAKLAWKATKGIWNTGANLVKGAGRLISGGLGGLFGGGGGNGAVSSDPAVNILTEIRDILREQFGMEPAPTTPGVLGQAAGKLGAGAARVRSGFSSMRKAAAERAKAWKDKIKESAAGANETLKKKAAKAAAAGAAATEGQSILAMLGKLVEMAGAAKMLIPGLGAGAAVTAGTATAATAATAATTAAAGTAAATTAGATAAAAATGGGLMAGVGTALMGLGGALAAFITAPVTLGVLATAAAAYGVYKGVQYYRNKLSPMDKLRLTQYGFHPDDTESYTRVLQMERILQERIVRGRSGLEIAENDIPIKDLMGIFDMDAKDRTDLQTFAGWYRQRMKPVFLTHMTALQAIGLKIDVDKISGLDGAKAQEYLKLASYSEGPYDYGKIPIKDPKYPVTTAADVDKVIRQCKAEMGVYKRTTELKPITGPNDKDKLQPAKAADAVSAAEIAAADTPAKAGGTLAKPAGGVLGGGPDAELPPKGGASVTGRGPIDRATNPQGLRLASGELLDGRNGFNLVKQDGRLKLDQMNPAFMKLFYGAVEEYYQLTGKRVTVTDAFRTYEDQVAMAKKYPGRAATPGHSAHGFGLALDASSKDLDAMDDLGLLRKYGLTRPVGGEPWHLEPAGVQLNMKLYARNQEMATRVIEEGIGRGGGGYGTVQGATMKERNLALAKNILEAKIDANVTTAGVDRNTKQLDSAKMLPIGAVMAQGPMGAKQPVKMGVGFSSADAEPKPLAVSTPQSAKFGTLPSGYTTSSNATGAAPAMEGARKTNNVRAAFSTPQGVFNGSNSQASTGKYNAQDVTAMTGDNTAGGGLPSAEVLLGQSVKTLGDIRSVLQQIYSAMTGENAKGLSAPPAPAPSAKVQQQAAAAAEITKAAAQAIKDEAKETTPASPTTTQVASSEDGAQPRSPIFALPGLPVSMKRTF